jgi:nitroimidazol reductase NimA-like FMN-containing flavoprotein (pyridoxamine 5'-phosphate oxidase superfamily)
MKKEFQPTSRTTLRRLPKRAEYGRDEVYSILDEAFICHVGFVVDGQPFVIPTGYARVGDRLYIHGSAASRMLKTLQQGIEICVTVTLVDGLVLARSAFHHSVNYRSVVILGRASEVTELAEKSEALRHLTEHIVPGRWKDVRRPNQSELSATTVLVLSLDEVSAKVRKGPPIDDTEDKELATWAGVIPLYLVAGMPEDDPELQQGLEPPEYALHYRRNGRKP